MTADNGLACVYCTRIRMKGREARERERTSSTQTNQQTMEAFMKIEIERRMGAIWAFGESFMRPFLDVRNGLILVCDKRRDTGMLLRACVQ